MKYLSILALLGSVLVWGCGDDESDSDETSGPANGPAGAVSSCMTASDCPDGHTCLQFGSGPAGCVPTCSAEVNECGGSTQCAGVGVLEVDV